MDVPSDCLQFSEKINKIIADYAEESIKKNLPQINENINSLLMESQQKNITDVLYLKIYEKCRLFEIESNQLNFLCDYSFHNKNTNDKIISPFTN